MAGFGAVLQLRAGQEACFVFGTDEVKVPIDVSSRSVLLSDLQSQTGEASSVHLALCKDDVRSWIACAKLDGKTWRSADLADDTALRGLKVRLLISPLHMLT